MMTLDEQKLKVCEKLPELIGIIRKGTPYSEDILLYPAIPLAKDLCGWREQNRPVNWPLEGLQVCHEAEKLIRNTHMTIITNDKKNNKWLVSIFTGPEDENAAEVENDNLVDAWLEALCRVWHPERFER